ncbi:retrotransposon hot spot (RHS) protein [Trypanosoma conorhini]|uniref:Retrotransposon hot spot (RHS) protein n=1 Tax=Trypanosoma conorhini TaxID=83891 RepID=A0A3R7JZ07_9TRYP|nr:retrotransposon hot spot (RHS) protein [Trypanosoma conorhini]RNE99131.1 retrotransposon hot spot (RHS) protein [Trypanosoma conorhini]
MSGRSEEEAHAAAASPANAVPQGQRRSRSGPDGGGSDQQPAAHRRRVGEAQQRPTWTLTSTVEEVLLFGREGPIPDIKLNDFLRRELGGRGVVEANDNVSLESFVAQPEAFIANEDDLRLTLASPFYTAIKEAIEDARRLVEHEVDTLQRWREFAQKNIVSPVGRAKLDAALAVAVEEEARQRREELEKLPWEERMYRSVYEARWSYVESGHATEPLGMRVVEANSSEPEKMWSAGEVNVIPHPGDIDAIAKIEEEEDEGEASDVRLEFLVLTSEKGWPYKKFAVAFKEVFVRKEVVRVWNVLKEDIDGWPTAAGSIFLRRAYVVVGTPGIGKSLAVGPFVLYQLLHYDAGKVPLVAYFVDGSMYLFHKTGEQAGTVVKYTNTDQGALVVRALAEKQIAGYYIFDVTKGLCPSEELPNEHWGGIVLTSPDKSNYEEWKKQRGALCIYVNCYTPRELKAFYAWQKRNSRIGEERRNTMVDDWKTMKQRIDMVGPLPRYVFDEGAFKARWEAIEAVLSGRSDAAWKRFAKLLFGKAEWRQDGTTHKLIKLVRVLVVERDENAEWGDESESEEEEESEAEEESGEEEEEEDEEEDVVVESSSNYPVSREVEKTLRRMVITENLQMSALLSALGTCCFGAAADLERLGCLTFLIGGVVEAVARKMKYIPRTAGGEPRGSVLADGHARGRFPSRPRLFEYKMEGARNTVIQKVDLETGVLYIPDTRPFPVLDAFYVAEVQPRAPPADPEQASATRTGDQSSAERVITFIGLQVTKRATHDTTASKMASFMEYMRSNFNNWEVLSEAMEWEFIYLRHSACTPMKRRQQCIILEEEKRSRSLKSASDFWERKVEQYQVQLDAEIAQLLVAANKRRLV